MSRLTNFLEICTSCGGNPQRTLSGVSRKISILIGASLTSVIMYTAFFGVFANLIQNSIALCLLLALTFMWYPANLRSPKEEPSKIDFLCVIVCVLIMMWTVYSQPRFEMRIPLVSEILFLDKVAGIILVLLALECCRRTAGIIVSSIAVVAVIYAFYGRTMPGILRHPGLNLKALVDVMYLSTEGIFGSLVGMIATVLYGFISFGVLLQATGGDKYFMDIALAIAGKKAGGPAKVAVLGSGLMGMISGSSVANIVTTGSITIPLMKSIGYKPEEAGAVEACASSGGQIMPPVMGAGAFLMADALGVSFFDIARVSFAPALLFYCALWFFNDFIAKKNGLLGMNEVPSLSISIVKSLHMWIPIGILIYMCFKKYSPFFSASVCVLLIYVAGIIKNKNGLLIKRLFVIMEECAVAMTSIVGIIAAAAIIVSIINITGLMIKSTSIILSISRGSMVITILVLLCISYIMGMGLPVTSCYVILAALGVSALVKCGATPIGAHLLLFWSAMVAGITPPVCVAAFVAANVAKADPMKTGFASLKMGSMFYFIPILFIYSNILNGSLIQIISIFVTVCFSVYFFASSVEGYYLTCLSISERIVAILIFLFSFSSTLNLITGYYRLILLGISVTLFILLHLKQRKKKNILHCYC